MQPLMTSWTKPSHYYIIQMGWQFMREMKMKDSEMRTLKNKNKSFKGFLTFGVREVRIFLFCLLWKKDLLLWKTIFVKSSSNHWLIKKEILRSYLVKYLLMFIWFIGRVMPMEISDISLRWTWKTYSTDMRVRLNLMRILIVMVIHTK